MKNIKPKSVDANYSTQVLNVQFHARTFHPYQQLPRYSSRVQMQQYTAHPHEAWIEQLTTLSGNISATHLPMMEIKQLNMSPIRKGKLETANTLQYWDKDLIPGKYGMLSYTHSIKQKPLEVNRCILFSRKENKRKKKQSGKLFHSNQKGNYFKTCVLSQDIWMAG